MHEKKKEKKGGGGGAGEESWPGHANYFSRSKYQENDSTLTCDKKKVALEHHTLDFYLSDEQIQFKDRFCLKHTPTDFLRFVFRAISEYYNADTSFPRALQCSVSKPLINKEI